MSDLATGVTAGIELDHVELHVDDLVAETAAWVERFGFAVTGTYADGGRRAAVLSQGEIVLVLAEGLEDPRPSAYVAAHGGFGVADIALRTPDVHGLYAAVVERGVRGVRPPAEVAPGVTTATVSAFGDITHTLVQRDSSASPLPPGFTPTTDPPAHGSAHPGLTTLDHFAVCVPTGDLEPLVEFYRHVFGFEMIFEEHLKVGAQAMYSKVVRGASGSVTLTILEPDAAAVPGQIDEFVKAHGGPGVQHIAFATDDAVRAVRLLGTRGVEFLATPGAYYEQLQQRIEVRGADVADLRALNLLVDEDHGGQLFQIFTRSTHPLRTLFFEVIQRLGAESFGSSNIRALYEAVRLEVERQPGAHR